MTRYFDLSRNEKLALTDETLEQATRIEAIHRGIKQPITLSDELKKSQFTGFSIPPNTTKVYEIMTKGEYHHEASGLAYLTQEAAEIAMQGAISVYKGGYGETQRMRISDESPCVRSVYIGLDKLKQFQCSIEELKQDNDLFYKLAEECSDDLTSIRQEEYNSKVRSEKRAQYMTLAKGDEEIARSFWSKAEGSDFPS